MSLRVIFLPSDLVQLVTTDVHVRLLGSVLIVARLQSMTMSVTESMFDFMSARSQQGIYRRIDGVRSTG